MHLLFRLNPTIIVGSLQLGDTKIHKEEFISQIIDCLVPGPSLFVPSICIHSNTQRRGAVEKKTKKKKQGSLPSCMVFIHHVSEHEVDVEG